MNYVKIYGLSVVVSLGLAGVTLLRQGFGAFLMPSLFLAGMLLGVALLYLDEFWAHSRYKVLDGEAVPLISRSVLFILAYLPLAFFLLTSSGSILGMGLILGIGVQLALEMLSLRSDQALFQARFLTQLKRPLSLQEVTLLSFGFMFFVAVSAVVTVL